MSTEPVRRHQDLLVWQRGIDLVETVYRATATWPASEQYGLTSQIRRAAVSIPANIAEGHGRGNDKELARFLAIARGSHREVETHLAIAARLQFLDEIAYSSLQVVTDDIGRLLHGLSRRLQRDLYENGDSRN